MLLAGGEQLPYDGLVIATGAAPKRLPGTDHLDGVHTLRTLDDCAAIRTALMASPRRVAVVGAGFIGAEVAATCRGLGIDVSMIEALPVPLERGLGPAMGSVVAELHRAHGVDVRLGVGVVLIEGGDRVERIRLTDGAVLDVDLVVIGIGVGPNTAWLEGSGLTIDNGVVCDATCTAAPGVVAAGDVARWPNRRFGAVMRVEHWDNAIAMGTHAARTLVAGPAAEPYEPIPWFWSDQYDRKIQLAGLAGPDDAVEVVSGSVDERRFVAFYGRGGRLVGVLGMSQPAQVIKWRALDRGGDELRGRARDRGGPAVGCRGVTGGAFLLLALALVAAVGDWIAVHHQTKGLEYVCKPLTMVLLVGVALALDPEDPTARAWFVVALLLCLLGDIFLMLPQDLFVFGLGAFLLGHLAYIVGMEAEGIEGPRFLVGIIIVMVLLALIGTPILKAVRAGPDPELAGPVVAYMFVISAMVATAIGVGDVVAIIGAGLFYVSDALIAWNRFLRETRHAHVTIMVTYHLAQMGLVLSLV